MPTYAALAGRQAALTKLALFDGASEPEYLHREAIPYETRKQHLQEYLTAKALEAKEPMGSNVRKGLLVGGGLGALAGGLMGGAGGGTVGSAALGALLGGAGGAGLGGLVQYGRVSGDHDTIDEARRLHQNPAAVDRALVQRVQDAIAAREAEEDAYREEMLAHARRQSYRDEGDRYARRNRY